MLNDVRLSKNFKLYEFDCKGGSKLVKLDPVLLVKLQTLRTRLGRPVNINSGYRTPEHNKNIGGSPRSQHMEGKACDIYVEGLTPATVARECEKIGFGGIGVYSNHVHVDTRDGRARW